MIPVQTLRRRTRSARISSLERSGRKIGIVGLLTGGTLETSSPGPGISFNDAKKALEAAIGELTAQNVNIIVALTHLGLENDRQLARAVDGVGIIVGGGTATVCSPIMTTELKDPTP